MFWVTNLEKDLKMLFLHIVVIKCVFNVFYLVYLYLKLIFLVMSHFSGRYGTWS